MSIALMREIWDHSPTTGMPRLLLLALADNANNEYIAWPSIPTLARKIRSDSRYTRRILQKLIKGGHVTMEKGQGPGGVNLYRIHRPWTKTTDKSSYEAPPLVQSTPPGTEYPRVQSTPPPGTEYPRVQSTPPGTEYPGGEGTEYPGGEGTEYPPNHHGTIMEPSYLSSRERVASLASDVRSRSLSSDVSEQPENSEQSTHLKISDQPENSDLRGDSVPEASDTPLIEMQEEQIQSGAAPRKSAPPPPRPITDEDENIDAKPTQRPNLPPSELEQYAGSGDENEGPQKPAQRVENEPVGEQAQMFEASGRTQSTKKRSTKPKKPTTVLLQAAERALGDLGLMVNRRDMLPALQEALDLGVTETELPDLLAWATQGYRSQYYSISRLPNDARAYRVYQTQEQRQRPPMTTDPELSAYLDSLAQTPEEREEQQAHIREYFRQREEAKKPENWWASPEEVARIQRQRDEEVRREEERRLKQRKRMALEKEKDIRKLPFELMPRQAQEIIASRPDMWERYGVTEERIAQCFG